jgi:hypothetical protein
MHIALYLLLLGFASCRDGFSWFDSVASVDNYKFVINAGIYISQTENGPGKCNLMDCPSNTVVSAVLPVILSLDQLTSVEFRSQAASHLSIEKCSEICNTASNLLKSHNEVLVIVTTCNHIAATLEALSTLRDNSDSFDLVVIDDYSVDGTADILIKQVCHRFTTTYIL